MFKKLPYYIRNNKDLTELLPLNWKNSLSSQKIDPNSTDSAQIVQNSPDSTKIGANRGLFFLIVYVLHRGLTQINIYYIQNQVLLLTSLT